jgi:hypothetical protein
LWQSGTATLKKTVVADAAPAYGAEVTLHIHLLPGGIVAYIVRCGWWQSAKKRRKNKENAH